MNIVITKGNAFNGKYTATEIANATDWTGTVSVYSDFPGIAIFQVPLALASNALNFTLSAADLLNLNSGVYYVVSNIKSVSLGIDSYRVDYLTVNDVVIGSQPMTVISVTITKVDGTPAGQQTRTPVNSVNGMTSVLGWRGVAVTVSHQVADEVSGVIIGTETVSAETNAAGYAQLSVIKGQTVVVSCPAFGKSVTVDTTGHDTIDLSSYF